MDQFTPRDGDLFLMSAHSSKTVLPKILESGVDATIFIPGPTYERDVDLTLADFARKSDSVDILVTSPHDEIRATIQEGHVELFPARVADYPLGMARLAEQHERVVGVTETAEPVDGMVSPGIMGLGVDVIVRHADVLIAEVNDREPSLPGLAYDIEQFDYVRHVSCPLPTIPRADINASSKAIGENVAELIPDGATLQLGIGGIPAAIAAELSGRTGFRLHSGFLGPFARDMIDDEIVTEGSPIFDGGGTGKLSNPAPTTCIIGPDPEFYEWAETSGDIRQCGIEEILSPDLWSVPNFTSINSAIEVDLQGQINATHIGTRILSGPGGQPDYFRRGRENDGGLAILALDSITDSGISKICAELSDGAPVTTAFYDVDYIVTDQGVADLRVATPKQREQRLIDVADPSVRDELHEATLYSS